MTNKISFGHWFDCLSGAWTLLSVTTPGLDTLLAEGKIQSKYSTQQQYLHLDNFVKKFSDVHKYVENHI